MNEPGLSKPDVAVRSQELPLCVDLDGTLIRSDTMVESAVAMIPNWRAMPRLICCLFRGRARFKRELAEQGRLDPELLPYCGALLAYLREQKTRGRRLVLATAANRETAKSVASHLALFDEVLASDDSSNMRGEVKREALCRRFGERQFSYAGNDHADIAIWRAAGSAVLVNTSSSVAKVAARVTTIEHRIGGNSSRARALLRALRPQQWLKNGLVFVPIITANALGELRGWVEGVLMFLAFCAVASAVYVINDLADLTADRQHPRKRNRPFASGDLPIMTGLRLVPLLLAMGAAAAISTNGPFFVLFYALLGLSYSVKLKEMPLVDLFALAGLYAVRLVAGGEATGHHVSLWLLAFSSFLFLSLATIKRVTELSALRESGCSRAPRRGYEADDLSLLQTLGMSASFVSSMVLALYVQSEVAAHDYARPVVLWAIVPLMLFWQCRLWLSTARGYMRDDPIVYAAKDWVSWLVGIGLVSALLLARLRL